MKNKKLKRKIECMVLLIFCISHLLAEPCGDVNSDGAIDILDALLIAQHYVGLNPSNFDAAAADVDGNGSIDIVDALLVAQYYVGLITELPGCSQTPTPTPGTGTICEELTCGSIGCGESDGATIVVSAGEDLQAAIDEAELGDTLLLEAGASFSGHFVLRNKTGNGCLTIRTSTADADLPPDVRVIPEDAPLLARLVTPGSGMPAVSTEPGAHHYRLLGLEIMPATPDAVVYEVVSLGLAGAGQDQLDKVPHHIEIDRCYIHGWPNANFKRGVGLNSADTCIIRSHISDFHSDFQDSQAICGTNGPGAFKILDNRLEGAAENVMFGGGLARIDQLVPGDIEIRGNHFTKPWAWMEGHPDNTGYTPWVKNLFEIKNGRNVVVSGNLLENNWAGADQLGYAILLTPRSEGGAMPWAVVENVEISHNIVRHVGGGVLILGRDTAGSSEQSTNIRIVGNLFEDIREEYCCDFVRIVQFNEVDGLIVNHNTFVYDLPGTNVFRTYGVPTTGFEYTDNIVPYGDGLWADCGVDQGAIDCLLPGAEVAGNLFVGGGGATLPPGNSYPETMTDVGFSDLDGAAGDFHGYALDESSPYAGTATDGSNPGFNPVAYDGATCDE